MPEITHYAYDLEFLEDGRTIELISIGIVSETGRGYYAVNSDMPWDRIIAHDWLVRNVLPSLPLINQGSLDQYLAQSPNMHPRPSLAALDLDRHDTPVKPRWVIANEVRDFLLAEGEPELWADWGAYDHVALCQLWGPMIALPQGIPMFTHDIEQELEHAPGLEKPKQGDGMHNALEDARHNMRVLKALGVVVADA